MAIDIVKLANGNIGIYDATSNVFLRSLSPDVVEIECNELGVVKVIEDNGNVDYFDPNEVANTQVLPAAAIPFVGNCAALAELLATDFFFVVSGGGTTEKLYYEGNYVSFVEGAAAVSSTSTYVPNFLFGFPIEVRNTVSVEELRIIITGAAAGDLVFGVYDSLDGKPNDLVFQTTAFNTGVGGVQTYALPAAQELSKGLYYVAYLSNSAPSTRIIDAKYASANVGEFDATFSGPVTLFYRNLAYNATLPATWGTPAFWNSASSYPFIPYVQFKVVY